jgi:hypothetical protein
MVHLPNTIYPILLYAETHFRFFRFMPSLLYKHEPEVVFDLPCRCSPGKDLPVFLLVNDIAEFPANVTDVAITVSQKAMPPALFSFSNPEQYIVDHAMSTQAKAYVFPIKRDLLPDGRIFLNCKAKITSRNKVITILNDNFFSSSKFPFSCFVASDHLPADNFCSYGDLHVHSQFSQSHVEFGPPIKIINLIASTCGLDFFAITDHSYDIACFLHNFLKTDPTLTRWTSILNDIESEKNKCIIIPGEEISCYNSKGKSIHACALGIKEYIPGSSDGARFNNLKTLKLHEVIHKIHNQGGLAFAAHPGSMAGFFQRIFLGRGRWLKKDMAQDIDAVQAVNNGFGSSWNRAKILWINELLKGRKLPLVAGNDSHGDFNRYRYVSIPFFSISENFSRCLSYTKTGVYKKVTSQEDLLHEIKRGATFVTSGPFLGLSTSQSIEQCIVSNDVMSNITTLTAILISSYEFGIPIGLIIYSGKYGEKTERIVFSGNFKEKYEVFQTFSIKACDGNGYLRAEAYFIKEDGSTTFAATSPCYFVN